MLTNQKCGWLLIISYLHCRICALRAPAFQKRLSLRTLNTSALDLALSDWHTDPLSHQGMCSSVIPYATCGLGALTSYDHCTDPILSSYITHLIIIWYEKAKWSS